MKPSPALVILSCLVLLATCQLQQPIDLSPTAHVPATPRPIASPPTAKPTAAVPTLTPPPLSPTIAQVLPTSTLVPPQSGTIKMMPVTPSAIDPAWTYWQAVDLTPGIQAVVTDDTAVWVGTSYGVYRVDPRTGTYTAYDEVGSILMLLPVEGGRLWADGAEGLFFFDGRQWLGPNGRGRSSGTGISSGPYGSIGIDKNGDLWVFGQRNALAAEGLVISPGMSHPTEIGRMITYLPYQVPKPLSSSTDLMNCEAWSAGTSREYGFSYRTPAECQAVRATRDSQNEPRYTFDRDGSVWWVTGSVARDDLTRMLHHRLKSIAVAQKLPTARLENTTVDQDLGLGIQVHAIAPDPTHGVWLGTERGLLYSDGETIQEIPLAQDQHTLRAGPRNITIDTAGTAWIITAQGVQNLPAHKSQWQDVHDFGLHGSINDWALGTLAAAREGGIWATHGQDLWRFGGLATTRLMTATTARAAAAD